MFPSNICTDSFVSEQGTKAVISPSAYLLFYRRRSSTPLGPPYLQSLVTAARNPADSASDTEEQGSPAPGRPLGTTTTSSGLVLPGAAPKTTSVPGGWNFDSLAGDEADSVSTKGEADADSASIWFEDEGVVESTEHSDSAPGEERLL